MSDNNPRDAFMSGRFAAKLESAQCRVTELESECTAKDAEIAHLKMIHDSNVARIDELLKRCENKRNKIARLSEKITNVYEAFKDKKCDKNIPCQRCDDEKRCQSVVALKDA